MSVCTIKHRHARFAALGDTGRQRWMVREVDPNDDWAPTTSWQFTDYSGEQPYVDYDVEFDFEADPVTADAYETLRYLDGSTVHAQQAATNGSVRYYHGDLTGSTNALTDTGGTMQSGGTTTAGGPFYYTAFGERCYYDTGASSWKIGGEFPVGSPRYMYDGGHGYENGFLALAGANSSLPAITLQHVGERWYQSDIGRFVQRDPIGLAGGLNVYEYAASDAINLVDPDGLYTRILINWGGEVDVIARNGYVIAHYYKWKYYCGRKYHEYVGPSVIIKMPVQFSPTNSSDNANEKDATDLANKEQMKICVVPILERELEAGARKVMERLKNGTGMFGAPITIQPEDVFP